MGGVAVEAGSIFVVAACCARIGVARCVLTSRSEAPSSSEIVTKLCRRVWG